MSYPVTEGPSPGRWDRPAAAACELCQLRVKAGGVPAGADHASDEVVDDHRLGDPAEVAKRVLDVARSLVSDLSLLALPCATRAPAMERRTQSPLPGGSGLRLPEKWMRPPAAVNARTPRGPS